jgi:hypothetical protein
MVEPMVSDYYNELPTTVRIINEMNEELDNVRCEKDCEIAELKKNMKEKDDFIQDMFDYFSDEPESVYMQKILNMDQYKNNPYIFHCDGCNCMADEREIATTSETSHYLFYWKNRLNIGVEGDGLICNQCFTEKYIQLHESGELIIRNILGLSDEININKRMFINTTSMNLDFLCLYTIRFIFELLSKDDSELNNRIMNIFKSYDNFFDHDTQEEENFVKNLKFLFLVKSRNSYYDMKECNEMDITFYRLMYQILNYPIELFTKRRNRPKNKLNPLKKDKQDLLDELLERWTTVSK